MGIFFSFRADGRLKDGTLSSRVLPGLGVLEMRHPKLDIGLLAAGWDQLSLLICVWLWVRQTWEGQDRYFRADGPSIKWSLGREQSPSELVGSQG